jgi:hypothetical protein
MLPAGEAKFPMDADAGGASKTDSDMLGLACTSSDHGQRACHRASYAHTTVDLMPYVLQARFHLLSLVVRLAKGIHCDEQHVPAVKTKVWTECDHEDTLATATFQCGSYMNCPPRARAEREFGCRVLPTRIAKLLRS